MGLLESVLFAESLLASRRGGPLFIVKGLPFAGMLLFYRLASSRSSCVPS